MKPSFIANPCGLTMLFGISTALAVLSPAEGQIVYALLTRAPLVLTRKLSSFDLHVLGTPPAFVLSQNQTLQLKTVNLIIAYLNKFFVKKFEKLLSIIPKDYDV